MCELTTALVVLISLQHLCFLLLEAAYWNKPIGRKIFNLKPEFANKTKKLAINQGIYNGFLAAGLIFGLLSAQSSLQILTFFLCCIIVAGIAGAITVSRSIFYIQALPSLFVLILILFSVCG